MKLPLLIGLLATSIVGNAMLYRTLATRTQPGSGDRAERTTGLAADPSAAARPVPAWRNLDTADLNQLPERLRSAGLPPKLVATITTARIAEQFAARRRQILGDAKVPYWNRSFFQEMSGGQAMRDLTREEREAVDAVLGSEARVANLAPEAIAQMQRLYGPLPVEKILQLQEISRDYQDLRQAVQLETGGLQLAEDRAKLALLTEEERKDMEALLTPAEFEEYQLRRSSAANQLRNQLHWVEVTEAEFRSLYRLQQSHTDQFSNTASGPISSALAAQRRTAEQALVAEAKAILGEERGAEFERNRDFSYRQLAALVDRLELPRSTAAEVIALRQGIQQRAFAAQTNANLTPEQRRAEVTALVREATEAVAARLGSEGAAAFRQTPGNWIQQLEMRANAGAARTP